MNDIAIITCVTGNHDYQFKQPYIDRNVDYIYFTDGLSEPISKNWRVELLPDMGDLDNRRKAKLPKLSPHSLELLNKYNYVLWIDGSMQIKSKSFVSDMMNFLGDGSILLSPHFDGRDCGYSEASIRIEKYKNEPLDEQVEFYRSEGFPPHFGLYECGVMLRNMSKPLVKEFGEIWYQQNIDYSYNDQVSCGYSLWKSGLTPTVLPKSWREFNWINISSHRSDL